jgi:hypothetical protein
MRVIFCSLFVLFVSLWSSVQAASNLDADTQRQLVRLEKKYFARSFDSDSDDSRVGRLEKQILGCTNSGDPEQRMKNIISATSSASITSGANQGFSGSVSAPDQSEPQTRSARNVPAPVQSDSADNGESTSGDATDSYPHVTTLEKTILQQTYIGQTLPARLARMELKAFGRASTDPDLSQRTDALEDYAEQKLHKKSPEAEADASDAVSSPDGQSNASSGEYPHITALEKEILGQTYAGQPLPDRLGRMETKAFGAASTDLDYSRRTDALEAYAEKTLHKKPFNQGDQSTASASQQKTNNGGGGTLTKTIANVVGNSILGMVGLGGGGMASPFGSGMGPGPGFMGGMGGMGGPGMGMGGTGGSRRRMAQNQNQEPEAPTEVRDPYVTSPTPPPPDARMITKVGWCEMQVFGQTFPAMHLPERLGKLNRELNFEPDKSNIELMDDVGKMIKLVAQRHPTQSIGSAPAPSVR